MLGLLGSLLESGGGGSSNDKGYFVDPTALNTAYPTGENGWYAVVGATDTFWIWDGDTTAWVNSGSSSTGNVVGPASSTDNNIAVFDGPTGKIIKDSGVNLASKQDTLVSGTNIKTINSTSILGSGDIIISGGSSAFNDITSGTNTTAAMVVGSGSSFGVSGTGTISATSLDGTISSASTATTQTQADNSTKVATTAYVDTGLGTKQDQDNLLDDISTLSGNGIIVRVDANTAASRSIVAGSSKISISNGSGVSGNPSIDIGTLIASDIPNLDASKITTGTIDIARLPAGAISKLVIVADQTARFALTTTEVQNGDSVKQTDTDVIYYVVDDTNLGNSAGYEIYSAETDWSLISNKPQNIVDIAAITPVNDDIIQVKSGSYVARSPSQFKTDLTLVKGDVGLGNVDNTSDADKPISTATQTALDLKQDIEEPFIFALGDEDTVITTGTKITFNAPYGYTLNGVKANLKTASSSGTPTFDINVAGVSILSTKITIDANETSSLDAAVQPVISTSSIANDAVITVDIDVAGTGAIGAKITFYWQRV